MFDYTKLKQRIIEQCGSVAKFSKEMPLSQASVYAKLNNQSEWTQQEVLKAASILDIRKADIPAYFFAELVGKSKRI